MPWNTPDYFHYENIPYFIRLFFYRQNGINVPLVLFYNKNLFITYYCYYTIFTILYKYYMLKILLKSKSTLSIHSSKSLYKTVNRTNVIHGFLESSQASFSSSSITMQMYFPAKKSTSTALFVPSSNKWLPIILIACSISSSLDCFDSSNIPRALLAWKDFRFYVFLTY